MNLHNLSGISPAFLLVFAIIITSLPGCTSKSNNQTSEILTLLFEKDAPQFVAFKDGNNAWEAKTVQSGKMELEVKGTSQDYGVVVYGFYGGISQGKGYFFKSNLKEINQMSFRFDDTGTKVDYTISGTASNLTNNSYLVAGTDNYRNFANYSVITSAGAYSFNYNWDADVFNEADVLLQLDNGGLLHYKKLRATFTNHAANNVDYSATQSDSGNTFSVDHSAVRSGPNYDGLGIKFSGYNLKAQLLQNYNLNDTETIDKFTAGTDDLFSVNANWSYTSPSFETLSKHTLWLNNPASVTFDTEPALPPSVSIGADADSSILLTFAGLYSGSLGLNDIARGARIKTADTQWNMYETNLRYSGGELTMGFDIDLTTLAGFPLNKEPIQSGSDIRVSYYQSSMNAQDFVDRELSGHRPAAKYNNSSWLRVSQQF